MRPTPLRNLLPLSIVVCTYARSAELREILECYRRTEYPGELELVILNDWDQQVLSAVPVDNKPITCVNLPARFGSLGAKRNHALTLAKHRHVLTVDDDDLFMPWYATEMMRSYLCWGRPTWGRSYAYAEGMRGTAMQAARIDQTFLSSALMRKSDALVAGGYPDITQGEDRVFFDRVTTCFSAHPRINPAPPRPGYIYRWANGVHHLSGGGDDRECYQAADTHAHARSAHGEEPTGPVALTPFWSADYIALFASAFP